jgi:sulfate adenylyltransferase subunit 1
MVTGASTADAAIILIDARKGVLTQTRRHTYIAHLLGVRHIIVAVNKMDLVDYDQKVFERIRADFQAFSRTLDLGEVCFIPMSALRGDQVVERGPNNLPWYQGKTLLSVLEDINVQNESSSLPVRYPVQLVVRPGTSTDFRGYAGKLLSGVLAVGDELLVLPSNRSSRVKEIVSLDRSLPVAVAGDSVTVVLEDEIDISRGDMLCDPASPPRVLKSLAARICWMSEEPLSMANRFVLKHTSRSVKAKLGRIVDRVDINTLERQSAPAQLAMNDIAHVTVSLAQPLFVDAYDINRETGSFILIDEATNHTVAVGMIELQ